MPGLGDAEERTTPTSLPTMETAGATSVACGAEYTLALVGSRGDVYSWGWCASRRHNSAGACEDQTPWHSPGTLHCWQPHPGLPPRLRLLPKEWPVAMLGSQDSVDVHELLRQPCLVHDHVACAPAT